MSASVTEEWLTVNHFKDAKKGVLQNQRTIPNFNKLFPVENRLVRAGVDDCGVNGHHRDEAVLT
jgi:hypothetical protein